jgi:hypothetical protein
MATHSGSEGKVFIADKQIAEVKSWSLEVTADTVDASTIGTEWRKNQATIKSWSGSFHAFWDEEDSNGQGKLIAGKTVTLNLYPEGNEEGSNYFTGNVIITSIGYSASFDGLVEASFSFTGTGALEQKIVEISIIAPVVEPVIVSDPIVISEVIKPKITKVANTTNTTAEES